MRLSPAQQERYARHLILDDFGGEGQERLLEAGVQVRGTGDAALWAARYLAASGIGELAVEVPAWHDELQMLGPWLRIRGGSVSSALQTVAPPDGAGPAESAANGARVALEVVRAIVQGVPQGVAR